MAQQRRTGTPAQAVRTEFQTSSPVEAAEFVRSAFSARHSSLLAAPAPFRFESGYLAHGTSSFEYISTLGHGRSVVQGLGTVSIALLTRGTLTVMVGTDRHVLTVGEMIMLGTRVSFELEWRDPFLTLARLDPTELERATAQAPGRSLDATGFVGRPCGPAQAAHLRATLDYLRRDVLSNPVVARDTVVRARTTEMLAAVVVNTFGTAVARSERAECVPVPAAELPPSVLRACRYMDANARRRISIDDVAAATRVSKRTLQAGFRRYLDVTPGQYLTSVRLAGARRQLLAEDPSGGVTVEHVMRTWHFTNAGRFAKLYRAMFAELPRATLAR